jgi:uncharacterized spore protein YtfJ
MSEAEKGSAKSENQTGDAQDETRQYDVIESTLDRFLGTADLSRAIGEPIIHGDQMIIPTAEVLTGLAFGTGGGGGRGMVGPGGYGMGGGGGGRTLTRPVAIIVAGPNGVEVTPIVDRTKIVLTALTAFGFMIATLGRFQRRPRG